jgi:hypothetical protein
MANDMTTKPATNVVIDEEMMTMGGMGMEGVKTKDVLIPRLVIIQGLSPQVMKKKAEYIEEAEVGDFCNVATGDIYKERILVIPCHFATTYIEWAKGRGGLVNNFGDDPTILKNCVRNDLNQNILPNGNEVQETAQWYCLIQNGASWERIFFPLSKTNLKHSRKWLTLCRTETVTMPDNKLWKPPLFWRSWNLIIIDESNDKGDWATFRPEKGDLTVNIDDSKQLLRMCKIFCEDIRTNAVRPDIEIPDDGRTINGSVNDPTNTEKAF